MAHLTLPSLTIVAPSGETNISHNTGSHEEMGFYTTGYLDGFVKMYVYRIQPLGILLALFLVAPPTSVQVTGKLYS